MFGKNSEGTWENLPYHSFKRVKFLAYNRKGSGKKDRKVVGRAYSSNNSKDNTTLFSEGARL